MSGTAGMSIVVAGVFLAGTLLVIGQTPATPPLAPANSQTPSGIAAGGVVHGTVRSGNVPLPGVTLTAQNTLTGKRFATTTDVKGAWSMLIPRDGRYVLRTEFAGFAQGAGEALLNPANRSQIIDFDLMLASQAAEKEQQQAGQEAQIGQAIRQLANNGPQSLNLLSALVRDTEAGQVGASTNAGAALPAAATSAELGNDSVSINGQAGSVSPLAGVDMDRLRDVIESLRAQRGILPGAGPGGPGLLFGGFGGGGFGGFGGAGFRGGRGNFRGFNPGQPHGAVYWMGSNSALNAEPFSLRGQPQDQPASGTNRFGVTFIGAPKWPGHKPSGKDTIFLNLSGSRNAEPVDQYATVPTLAERAGILPGVSTPLTPLPQATALLQYIPEPNLPGDSQNYHLLTTQQSNTTQGGIRYMRSFGANATPFAFGGFERGRTSQSAPVLRQSIHLNYNWSHAASDDVNIVPGLGGKTASDSDSVQAGYTVGRGKVTSIFNAGWNRTNAQTTNFFTNRWDIATQLGILGPAGSPLNASPLNYGLPSIVLSSFTGITQTQPSFSISQTISVSETIAWRFGKHNLRSGGDYRRVHRDFLGGNNVTGTFYFTGLYTGSALGDFLSGQPQETSIDASAEKAYLRDNVFDLYVMDDWRARSNLTFNYGLRYEFFAPYNEKYNRLSMVDTNPSGNFSSIGQIQAGEQSPNYGQLPDSLVRPFRLAFAPRLGLAWRLGRQTVVRAGYGMNYTVSAYSTFANAMAHQPPFANEQTNICQNTTSSCYSLANGFPAPDLIGNYAVDAHYRLPRVQVWNIDIQKTIRWGILLNAGYNGSWGSNLDVKIAPRAVPSSPNTDPGDIPFFFEEYGAFSRFNAGTLRVNKRLSSGLGLGAYYQYAHSIDDAGSIGGTSSVVAQNWQDIEADAGNSTFDIRHKVSGYYLYELPFGKDKFWFTSGKASHLLEGFSVSGNFTFATGTPLTPTYQASIIDVGRGTTGTQRPDRQPGVSLTAGGGSLQRWFNTEAFLAPSGLYGDASRNSIPGPGTVSNDMSLSKTMQLGDTRSLEIRATANNVFNTVQYSGVNTTLFTSQEAQYSSTFGQVTSVAAMRSFQFTARFRF